VCLLLLRLGTRDTYPLKSVRTCCAGSCRPKASTRSFGTGELGHLHTHDNKNLFFGAVTHGGSLMQEAFSYSKRLNDLEEETSKLRKVRSQSPSPTQDYPRFESLSTCLPT
jgi:hypothetical protein